MRSRCSAPPSLRQDGCELRSNVTLTASVVLRSYKRVDSALEAAERLRQQDYPFFEIVLLEQTPDLAPDQEQRLAALARDSRVRVIRSRPLGGPGSRNEGARQSRGDVIVFLDDDDLPADTHWLSAHMRNYDDPLCLAVTGRHIFPESAPPYPNMVRARRLVLTYSPLMWQRAYARVDTRSTRVQSMLGTNSSVRRSAIERFGLWDECTRVEDEASFCFRMLAGKWKDEYLVFDPEAAILRRLDIRGGLDKRSMTTGEYGAAVFEFLHNIVGHYHTKRFVLLYPCYVALLAYVSIAWVALESHAHRSAWQKALGIAGVLVLLPFRWIWWLSRWCAGRLAGGAPARYEPIAPT